MIDELRSEKQSDETFRSHPFLLVHETVPCFFFSFGSFPLSRVYGIPIPIFQIIGRGNIDSIPSRIHERTMHVSKTCFALFPSRSRSLRKERNASIPCLPSEDGTKATERRWDVESVVVRPCFRDSMDSMQSSSKEDPYARKNEEEWIELALVSESGICRAPLAAALLRRELSYEKDVAWKKHVRVSSRASGNHCQGMSIESKVIDASKERRFLFADDDLVSKTIETVSLYDLVLAMDKFTLEDVLRMASISDLSRKDPNEMQLSKKIRRFGEFTINKMDVEDPLYGNQDDEIQWNAMNEAISQLEDGCRGIVDMLHDVLDPVEGENAQEWKRALRERLVLLDQLDPVEWRKPPMLRDGI